MELEVRHLRYVVEVADQRHFSRAAAGVGISQSALSQQILKVERRLGFELFARHPGGTTPTPAGAVFIAEARKAVAAFDAALDRAVRRRRGETGRLVVGFTAASGVGFLPRLLSAFFACHPGVDVQLVEAPFTDRSAGLVRERSDVAFVRLPLEGAGLRAEVVAEEPLFIALAHDHPLATCASVTVADILDEPLVCVAGIDEAWARFWRLDDYRPTTPARVIAYADTCEAEMQIVASGRASVVTSAVAPSHFARPGVAFVPIEGVAPSQVAVAHRAGDPNPLVHAVVRLARELSAAPLGLAA
jgi:DNA-binding transcriptional LysR family regulator